MIDWIKIYEEINSKPKEPRYRVQEEIVEPARFERDVVSVASYLTLTFQEIKDRAFEQMKEERLELTELEYLQIMDAFLISRNFTQGLHDKIEEKYKLFLKRKYGDN